MMLLLCQLPAEQDPKATDFRYIYFTEVNPEVRDAVPDLQIFNNGTYISRPSALVDHHEIFESKLSEENHHTLQNIMKELYHHDEEIGKKDHAKGKVFRLTVFYKYHYRAFVIYEPEESPLAIKQALNLLSNLEHY